MMDSKSLMDSLEVRCFTGICDGLPEKKNSTKKPDSISKKEWISAIKTHSLPSISDISNKQKNAINSHSHISKKRFRSTEKESSENSLVRKPTELKNFFKNRKRSREYFHGICFFLENRVFVHIGIVTNRYTSP